MSSTDFDNYVSEIKRKRNVWKQTHVIDEGIRRKLSEEEIAKTLILTNYYDNEGKAYFRVTRHLRDDTLAKRKKRGILKDVIETRAFGVEKLLQSKMLEVPQKSDIEYAKAILRKSSEQTTNLSAVLDQVEIIFMEGGRQLKPNWREITKRNIEIWFSNKK